MRTRRRTLILGCVPGMAGVAGCLEAAILGCQKSSKYTAKLTAVSTSRGQRASAVLQYSHLSRQAKLVLEKAAAADDGRYSKCRSNLSDAEKVGFQELGQRIEANSSGFEVFIRIKGTYYQLGLLLGDIYYAITDHSTDRQ